MIILTGWNGYVGSIIQEVLNTNNIKFIKAGRGSKSELYYSLDSGFSQPEKIKNSKIIHCAYEFKENSHLNNINGTKILASQVKAQGASLMLISSTSVSQSNVSEYARTKLEIEKIITPDNNTKIIRIGILHLKDNFFIRLLSFFTKIHLTIYPINSYKIFILTEFNELASAIVSFSKSKIEPKLEIIGKNDQYNFIQLQKLISNKDAGELLFPLIPYKAFILFIKLFPIKFNRLTRIRISLTLLNGTNENLLE